LNKENLISVLSDVLSDLPCGTIGAAEILKVLKSMNKMEKISCIKKQYQNKVKRRKDDNRYYIYINRKQLIAHTEDELFEKIYCLLYGIETFTIFQLFPMYIKYKQENTAVKGLTLKKYINDFKKYYEPYKDDLLNKPFIDLTAKDYIRLFNRWTASRKISSKQFNNLKSIINGIYVYSGTELDLNASNRIRDIDMRQFPLKPTKPKDNAFTAKEREQVMNYLSDKEDPVSLALRFNFYCGLRIGELLALKYSDIENGLLQVNGQYLKEITINNDLSSAPIEYFNTELVKGYSEEGYRRLPLHDEALKIIKIMRKQNPFGEYIFMKDGKQLHPNTCGSRIRRICKKLGLKERGTHALRFTYASILYRNGLSVLNISKLLGHRSTTMTSRYVNDIMPKEELNELIKKAL